MFRLFSLTIISLFLLGDMAYALPDGGNVVSGASTMTQPNAATLQINQTTDRSIINWQGYNIGANEQVFYFQPSANSISLNRVVGVDPSHIYGSLSANGQVWVINPNGLLVGNGAKINVGSFLGSTLNINDNDFQNQHYQFNTPTALSSIINQGEINAGDGGFYVVLISPSITNDGAIRSNLGKSVLASGNDVTVHFAGNDLIGFKIDQAMIEGIGITNTGKITANGGEVILSAKGAGDLFRTVINNTGIIEAQSIEEKNGVIKLLGGMEHNAITVGGTLDASAQNGRGCDPCKNGGFIETSAGHVKVADDAIVTTLAPHGMNGMWLIDPTDFIIAASGGNISGSTLSTNLGGGNVTLMTASTGTGNGDLFVNDVVSWATNNTLTLQAHHNVVVNANITATGNTAGLVLTPNAFGLTGGSLNNSAKITLSGSNPSLNMAGVPYTVINNVTALQNMNVGLSNSYALGSDIDASGAVNFLPVGDGSNRFTGRLDGLNHTITNLIINRQSQNFVGLFGATSGAAISNVGLLGGSVTGNNNVGGLVGDNAGTIQNVYVTGNVIGMNDVGGLGGSNGGTISNSYATGSVSGNSFVGGLLGRNGGTISNVYSTGSVSGTSDVGGLLGRSGGIVSNSFWDTQTSGQGTSAGGIGLTTVKMKQLSTFVNGGWSISGTSGSSNIWRIDEGQT
jgi:filamentous hemagglutinin family protein